MFQPGELKTLVPAFTHPLIPLNYLFPTCHSSSHLRSSPSAQKQPWFAHLLSCCSMDGKGTWLDPLLQARGGREEIRKKKKQAQLCQAQGLEFGYSDCVRCWKSCATSLGKGVGSGSCPLVRAVWSGHRNAHRWPQVSEHKQGDVTPVFLFPW